MSEPAATGDDVDGGIISATERLNDELRTPLRFGGGGVRDITEEFAAAAKRLAPGQLVKDEWFTLFESVGALEVLDARNDPTFLLGS